MARLQVAVVVIHRGEIDAVRLDPGADQRVEHLGDENGQLAVFVATSTPQSEYQLRVIGVQTRLGSRLLPT